MPTTQDVIDAFDALGGTFNQAQALRAQLEKKGFEVDAVVTVINQSLATGLLVDAGMGSLRKA